MANRIAAIREDRGLPVAELAARVGTTRQQMYRLESGERRLTADWMLRIARALGCDPAELMERGPGLAEGGHDRPPPAAPLPAGPDADELFGDLQEGLAALYRDEGINIAQRDLAKLAFAMFQDLAADADGWAADPSAAIAGALDAQRGFIRKRRAELLRTPG